MQSVVLKQTVCIKNRFGIHARPALAWVDVASRFESALIVRKDGMAAEGKSILHLMMLKAGPGSILHLEAEGRDARELLDSLTDLVEKGFGESKETEAA